MAAPDHRHSLTSVSAYFGASGGIKPIDRCRDAQKPLNSGGRRSAKARSPSPASAVPTISSWAQASSSNAVRDWT